MEYLDQTDYEERAARANELLTRQGSRLSDLPVVDRSYLDRYFIGALHAPDRTRYRNDQLKLEPNMEMQANKAYERLLAELQLPESLPANDG